MIRDAGRRRSDPCAVTLTKREAHRGRRHNSVDQTRKKRTVEGTSGATESDRRRIGTIVHDDRGMASVEWQDAPADFERPVLRVAGEPALAVKDDASYDPYARHTATFPGSARGATTRTDLRKLSEWIKMKRELEERKLRGELDDADDES